MQSINRLANKTSQKKNKCKQKQAILDSKEFRNSRLAKLYNPEISHIRQQQY